MASKNLVHDTLEKFRKEILNGRMPFGKILPTEIELADQMKVSRPTIAKVYNALQKEGLVKKRQGYGTTVIYNKDRKQFTFGLLLPGSGETEIFGVIIDQLLALEKEKDFDCLWDGTIANNAEMRQSIALQICKSYIEKKVDGVFFSPLERTHKASQLNETICKTFDSHDIPMVLIDRDMSVFPNRSKYDIVGIDNFHAGYIMTEHLIKAGCEKIVFFHRKDSASTVPVRLAGCQSACLNSGLDFGTQNVVEGEPSDGELVGRIKILPGKTGILCANDSTAAVLMSTLSKSGTRVGIDTLIAGFDDMKYAKHLQVPLTSYRQPLADIVRNSYDMMIRRISNPKQTTVSINLSGKLIIRESTRFR
jgi:GntR family transcriptional regulator, arabinose operon transcriptional repressor